MRVFPLGKLPPARHQRDRRQQRGQRDQPGLRRAAAQVVVDQMVHGVRDPADQVPAKRHHQAVGPDRGQQQGRPDAELESADVVDEVPVRREVDEIAEGIRPAERPCPGRYGQQAEQGGDGLDSKSHTVRTGLRPAT
jgi:hypothetical protein